MSRKGYRPNHTHTIQADHEQALHKASSDSWIKVSIVPDETGEVLRAWRGAGALDYFETTNTVDAKKAAIEGHSR